MSKFTIEKGVQFPHDRFKEGLSATLRNMQIGDSVFVKDKTRASQTGIYTVVSKKVGFNFISRNVDGGCRIWRIA